MKQYTIATCLLGILILTACSDDHPVLGYYPQSVTTPYISRPVQVSYPVSYPSSYYPVRYYPYTPTYNCTRAAWPRFYSSYANVPCYQRWAPSWLPRWYNPARSVCSVGEAANFYETIATEIEPYHYDAQPKMGYQQSQLYELKLNDVKLMCDDPTYKKEIAEALLPPRGLKLTWQHDGDDQITINDQEGLPLRGAMLDNDSFQLGRQFTKQVGPISLAVATELSGVTTNKGASALSHTGIEVTSSKDDKYQAECLLTASHELIRN